MRHLESDQQSDQQSDQILKVEWDAQADGYRVPFEHEWEMAIKRSMKRSSKDYKDPLSQLIKDQMIVDTDLMEWCNNLYADLSSDPYAYSSSSKSSRAVRWMAHSSSKKSSGPTGFKREWRVPSYQGQDLGFRVVRPSHLSDSVNRVDLEKSLNYLRLFLIYVIQLIINYNTKLARIFCTSYTSTDLLNFLLTLGSFSLETQILSSASKSE